ncbi:unnamed protein product [[Candida] boidinii]|uniref:Biogenesis of lysosome-related organelles complex 1 subunit CNL1 n=1 Tax=Candida boidinii TaxID=5477 RepID=A0A9W6T3J6_CANBO|nr:hypothetical protein B5S33_g691 [[Candida] boidinii]GME73889.1 unnamed protein product [[Candida] boidinii]GMF97693.1 unnamed protein product [[Candida] boidinii]
MDDSPSIKTGKPESDPHTLPRFKLGMNKIGIGSLSFPSASIDINKGGNGNGNGNGNWNKDGNANSFSSSIPIVSVNHTGVPGSFVSSSLTDGIQDSKDDERLDDATPVYNNDDADYNEDINSNNDSSFLSQKTSNAKVLSKRLSRHFASKLRLDEFLQISLAANGGGSGGGDSKKFVKPISMENDILDGSSYGSATHPQGITESGLDIIDEPELTNQLNSETEDIENTDEREQFEMETEDNLLDNGKLGSDKDNLKNDNDSKNFEIDPSLKDNKLIGDRIPSIENENNTTTGIQVAAPVKNIVECGLDDGEEYEDIDVEYLADQKQQQENVLPNNNFGSNNNTTVENDTQDTDDAGDGKDSGIADEDEDEDEGNKSTSDEDESNGQHEDESDDPLNVKELALSFDYLTYKIQDRVKTLSENIEVNLSFSKSNYEMEIFKITENLEHVKMLIKECDYLNDEFSKLEQINLISRDFVSRLTKLDKRLKIQLKNLKK